MKKLIQKLLGFTPPKPMKTVCTVLRQLVQWIPPGMIQRLADRAYTNFPFLDGLRARDVFFDFWRIDYGTAVP